MNDRILGYILLLTGILIMFGALIQVLLVFSGKTDPLPVFSIQAPKISLDSFLPKNLTGITLPGSTSLPSPQPLELISTKDLNRVINISATIFLMGFVLSFGFKISSLGVMLIRPVVVKANTKIESSQTTSGSQNK